jgi:RimJ/RimL family protein N-acetyltransferase
MESRDGRQAPARAGDTENEEEGESHSPRERATTAESEAREETAVNGPRPTQLQMSRTLRTPRLMLRIPEASDAQPLLEIHEHPDSIKFVTGGPARRGIIGAWSSVATMVGHWQLRGYGQWTVIEQATGEVIGRVGLWNPEGWPGVELGWIIRHSRWGNGFATEAARTALDWAWANTVADHIISLIQPENTASIRVAEKIGERLERREVINAEEVCIYGVRRP